MKFLSSTIFILLFLTFGCKNSNTIQVKDDNGNVLEKYTISADSLKQGPYLAYFKNGSVREEAHYIDGKLSGERKIFNSKGQIEIIESYENNQLNGPHKTFHANGQLKIDSEYSNDLLQGLLKSFDENGQLKEEVTFKSNEENGPFKEYFDNGQIEWEGEYYKGDNEYGLLKQYNREGALIKKMMCDSTGLGICRTIWTIADGDIIPKVN